jgi:hypothetical protein
VIPDQSKAQEYSKFFQVYKTMYSGLQHSMHLLYKTITT